MKLKCSGEPPLLDEMGVMLQMLTFEQADLLELGCGSAVRIEQIEAETDIRRIVAAEVDPFAHKKNLNKKIDKIHFVSYGAENIQEKNEVFDIVLMLKSLHHVSQNLMIPAMDEIYRVLKPGGVAYISEPVFDGELNEIIRLFHDEEAVREHAFNAIKSAVRKNRFQLLEEFFYCTLVQMKSFSDFRSLVIDSTHTNHNFSATLLDKIKLKFESYRNDNDKEFPFNFKTPHRVDLLKKN